MTHKAQGYSSVEHLPYICDTLGQSPTLQKYMNDWINTNNYKLWIIIARGYINQLNMSLTTYQNRDNRWIQWDREIVKFLSEYSYMLKSSMLAFFQSIFRWKPILRTTGYCW